MNTESARAERRLPSRVAMAAYAALFVVALPAALLWWGGRLDRFVHVPACGSPVLGLSVGAVGLLLMVASTADLWRFGCGLPMSPFPPDRLVTRGVYRLVADPIYVGAVLLCGGMSVALSSPGGLWVVTPILAGAATSFVLGFERAATIRRFGAAPDPLFRLPPPTDAQPTLTQRATTSVLVFGLWMLVYESLKILGVPPGARDMWTAWDAQIPILPWTEILYAGTYLFSAAAPLVARTSGDLRTFARRALWATALIGLFYLLVPLTVPSRPAPPGSIWTTMMQFERWMTGAPVEACPAFPVVWVLIAAPTYLRRWPRRRMLVAMLALGMIVSTLTTGMHSLLDVIGAVIATALLLRGPRLWHILCRMAEGTANGWREWTVGPVRFLIHGLFAAAGAGLGVAVATALAGPHEVGWLIVMALAGELGAGIWAQVLEGSPQLLRPYGYFGGVTGITVLGIAAAALGHNGWLILAATAVGGCLTQAFGRVRCLIQGCCHGRPVDAAWGIRYHHPRSRVLRLGHLGGVRLHPTPLYSILWMLTVGAVLTRLWLIGVPLPFICGAYLILVGLERFVEERYRGEPQTAWIAGLSIYQWLAIGFVILGAALTTVAGPTTPHPPAFDFSVSVPLGAFALATYLAFGVDFPGSNRRFSRLA